MISMIVCADMNGAIGKDNKLLCKLSDDLKYFREKTLDKFVVMGRKTWESIGSKPLRDRMNVVISSNPNLVGDDRIAVVTDDVYNIINLAERFPDLEIMIMGGSQIYELFLPYAEKIYITRVHNIFEDSDAFFPVLDLNKWVMTNISKIKFADEKNDFSFHHETFELK